MEEIILIHSFYEKRAKRLSHIFEITLYIGTCFLLRPALPLLSIQFTEALTGLCSLQEPQTVHFQTEQVPRFGPSTWLKINSSLKRPSVLSQTLGNSAYSHEGFRWQTSDKRASAADDDDGLRLPPVQHEWKCQWVKAFPSLPCNNRSFPLYLLWPSTIKEAVKRRVETLE